ncbi:MAG: hypothetical protein KBA91_01265 [Candidatus Moranbacteria bacterium]|nr:hypothetical protein [Candidatus Moranbacteria bacterium]
MDIIGHKRERIALHEAFQENRQAQAYVFSGPQSIGKSRCALEYAALLAHEPDFVPTPDKPHPFDVSVVRPLQETKRGITKLKRIAAETIREALMFLSVFPTGSGFRVLIIEDAHLLSETAQNVLLKTLEEPQSTAVIILVTHEEGALLSTVRSRVRRVRFDFVPEAELRLALEGKYDESSLGVIAPFFYALGRPGMVLTALAHPDDFIQDRELLGSLFRLSTLTLTERMKLAETLAIHTGQTTRLLEWWLPGLHQQARTQAEPRMLTKFFVLLEATEETLHLLKTTQSNARLLLEKLFLSV